MTKAELLAAADLERFVRFDRDIARLEPTVRAIAADVPRLLDELARALAVRSPGCRLRWVQRHDELAWDLILGMPNHVLRAGIRVTPVRDGVVVWPVFEGPPAPGSHEVVRSVRGADLAVHLLGTIGAVAIGALTVCQPIARAARPALSESHAILEGPAIEPQEDRA